jgi:hypothetical protein
VLTFKIDGVDRALDRMRTATRNIERVRHDEMPAEMNEWQIEDMRRARPHTTGGGIWPQTIVGTRIWPRSRRDLKPGGRRRSTRPILRPQLQERLWERMRALLAHIKWA